MRFSPSKPWRQPVYLLVVAIAGGLLAWHAVKQSGSGSARITTALVAPPIIQAGSVKPALAEATTAPIDGQPAGDPLSLSGEDVGAQAREADAAFSAYRQGLRCLEYARRVEKLKGHELLLEHPEYTTRDPATLLEEMESDLAYIKTHGPACQGREGLLTDGSMYEITLRAALAGDRDAMNCYASAPFEIPHSLDADMIAAGKFRRHAVTFIESGIRAGDWNAVLLNQIRHDPHTSALPFSQLASRWFKQFKREDSETTYTYIRLRQMGAQAVVAPDMEHLQQLAIAYQQPLTVDQIASAEKQAAELYNRYFIGVVDYPGKGGFCNF